MTVAVTPFSGFGTDTLNHTPIVGISRYFFIVKDEPLDTEHAGGKPKDPTLLELFTIAAEEFAKAGLSIKLGYVTREEKSNGKILTPAELADDAVITKNLLVQTYMGITVEGGDDKARANAVARIRERIAYLPCFSHV